MLEQGSFWCKHRSRLDTFKKVTTHNASEFRKHYLGNSHLLSKSRLAMKEKVGSLTIRLLKMA